MGAALLAAYTGAQGAQPTIAVKLARPATAAGTPPNPRCAETNM